MAKKKTIKSLTELKSWLEGLVEFQDSDWTPDSKQWAAIMKAIKSAENDPLSNDDIIKIVEDYKKKNGEIFDGVRNQQQQQHQQQQHQQHGYTQPPPVDNSLLQQAPPVDTYNPTEAEMEAMLEKARKENETVGKGFSGDVTKVHKKDEFV